MSVGPALAMGGASVSSVTLPRLGSACGGMGGFSPAAFRAPDSFFAPSTMWIWSDVLSEDRPREQVRSMASQGLLGAMPLAEPKEFRPTFMPTRVEPEYLSPEFMGPIRATVEEGEPLGQRIWLHDEGG